MQCISMDSIGATIGLERKNFPAMRKMDKILPKCQNLPAETEPFMRPAIILGF